MTKVKKGFGTGILREQVIRDLNNAEWFRKLNPANQNVRSVESAAFYENRAGEYLDTVEEREKS